MLNFLKYFAEASLTHDLVYGMLWCSLWLQVFVDLSTKLNASPIYLSTFVVSLCLSNLLYPTIWLMNLYFLSPFGIEWMDQLCLHKKVICARFVVVYASLISLITFTSFICCSCKFSLYDVSSLKSSSKIFEWWMKIMMVHRNKNQYLLYFYCVFW